MTDLPNDAPQWGPAMTALTEKQRNYVLAMASDPFGNPTRWARAAGYSDASSGAKVRAHYLSQDPKVEAAVQEYGRAHLNTFGPLLASAGLLRIARDKKHPKHLRALEMVANRVGLHETTEHHVRVDHTDRTGVAMVERIKALAAKHGMDAASLLGGNVVPALPAPIEGEFTVLENEHGERSGPERAVILSEGRPSDPERPAHDGGPER